MILRLLLEQGPKLRDLLSSTQILIATQGMGCCRIRACSPTSLAWDAIYAYRASAALRNIPRSLLPQQGAESEYDTFISYVSDNSACLIALSINFSITSNRRFVTPSDGKM